MLKKIGMVLGVLVGLIVVLIAGVYIVSGSRMNKTYEGIPVQPVPVPTDAASLEEGKRLFTTRGCGDCHTPDGGGGILIDDPAIAYLWTANLTTGEGGIIGKYDDATLARVIRNGVDYENKPVLFMPSHEFQGFSDEETGLIIAYIRSLPPVDRVPEFENTAGPLGRILFLAGQIILVPAEVVDHDAPKVASVTAEASVEFGAYLGQGCIGCHGPGYSGGAIPGAPPDWPQAKNITPDKETGIGNWTQDDFFTAIRTGIRPDGTALNPFMPWQNFSQMTDTELEALWMYLQTLPAKEFGNR